MFKYIYLYIHNLHTNIHTLHKHIIIFSNGKLCSKSEVNLLLRPGHMKATIVRDNTFITRGITLHSKYNIFQLSDLVKSPRTP